MVGIYSLEDVFSQTKSKRDIWHKQHQQQQQDKNNNNNNAGGGGGACQIRERTLFVPQAIILLTIRNDKDNETRKLQTGIRTNITLTVYTTPCSVFQQKLIYMMHSVHIWQCRCPTVQLQDSELCKNVFPILGNTNTWMKDFWNTKESDLLALDKYSLSAQA